MMLVLLSSFTVVFGNSIALLCSTRSKQFGIHMRNSDGHSAFVSGKIAEDGFVEFIGTEFGRFSEYVDGDGFVFPADKYPGLISASKHISHTYVYEYQKYFRLKEIVRNDHHVFARNKSTWTESCPKEAGKIKEIYNKLLDRLNLKTILYAYPGSFYARFNQTHLFVNVNNQSRLFNLDDTFTEVLTHDSKPLSIPKDLKQPAVVDDIFTEDYDTYTGSFTEYGPSKAEIAVFMRVYKQGKTRKMVILFVAGSFTDTLTGLPAIAGTVTTQKFINGCCEYRNFAFKNNFQITWDKFKFEDHWYWSYAKFFITPPKNSIHKEAETRVLKARLVHDVNENVKDLQNVYNEHIIGKSCVWLETGIQGILVSGFQWLSGNEIKQIYLIIVNNDDYKIDGCGPIA
jgi:hypothetical protein